MKTIDNFDITKNPDETYNAQVTRAAIVATDERAVIIPTMLAGSYPVRLRP
ncbi:hypothetical protein ACVOMS_32825 [Bradyrhizobium guangxiense]